MNPVTQFLKTAPLLFDGAMGSYYFNLLPEPLPRCEYANLEDPDTILSIHKAYLKAGAKAIKTNSFSLSAIAQEEGIEKAVALAKAGWQIGKTAIGETNAFLFADFGPPPVFDSNTLAIYHTLIDSFLEEGATNFIFETFLNDSLIRELSPYIRKKCPDAFIIGSFAVLPDGFTTEGLSGTAMVNTLLSEKRLDAAGFNCVSGPAHLLNRVKELDNNTHPISIMPNAGYPTVIGERTIYQSNPDYFAKRLLEMVGLGVKIIGGCCGTDPTYIEKTALLLNNSPNTPLFADAKKVQVKPQTPVEKQRKNKFAEKLLAGEKVIAVELDSPLDSNIEHYMEGAADLKAMGADIITIADCPVARSRMDSSIVACKLKRELGIDALPHLTCRDRNINATRALLLGLSAEEVHNVLIVTGDPIPTAERKEVKSVFNFHARMLIRYIAELNHSVFRTPFLIGGALNVNAVNFDAQLRLGEEKAKNGAQMLLTQPVMTENAIDNLRRAKENLDIKILGGIMPLVSHRNASFIASEIQGMAVNPQTVDRFLGKDKEEAAQIGIDFSMEIAREIKDDIDGFYLVTPFSRTDVICRLMEEMKSL